MRCVRAIAAALPRTTLVANAADADREPLGKGMRHDHLPEAAQPWKSIWSAGQGIDLIKDIPTVKTLVERLRLEYSAACKVPDMSKAATLVDEVRSS